MSLGLSPEELAADYDLPLSVIAAWERGTMKVPRRIAVDLTWRVARAKRERALEASGLAKCPYMGAVKHEPVPGMLKAQNARLERIMAHTKTCDICLAREAFVNDHFASMPPAPAPAWLAVIGWFGTRIERLPRWARPAAIGATLGFLFGWYRVVRARWARKGSVASGG